MILQARFHQATSHALIIYTVCFTFQLSILETIKKNFETTTQMQFFSVLVSNKN